MNFLLTQIKNQFFKITQQTFVLMKTSFVFVFRKRLDQDEYVRLSLTSSEDVFKTSWSRPIYSSWPCVFKRSSRRFQDVFKTSCQDVFKTFSKHLQDVLQKRRQDILKTSSKLLQDVLKTSSRHLQDVFKTYYQVKVFLVTQFQDIFETYSKRF